MRGESYFIGMRSLGQQASIPEDGGLFFLCCIDRDWAVTQCFAEEAFQAITDFNDLPNSLFACNVHQSVFEEEESKAGETGIVFSGACSGSLGVRMGTMTAEKEKGCSQLIMNVKCSKTKQTQEGSIERLLGLGVFVEYTVSKHSGNPDPDIENHVMFAPLHC
ncbi:hypothetical protein ACRRTK_021780 [Alexandromys fortis]